MQPASHALKVNTFFPYIESLYSDETNMQSINPMLLPICIAETQRSATPDGCFTRNCANMKCKESSCPRICQEIAHQDGRMLVQTETSNLGRFRYLSHLQAVWKEICSDLKDAAHGC